MVLCNFGHFYIAHFLMHRITFELCMLGFEISYLDSSCKHNLHVFFSYQDYGPFLSYGPLKKSG